MFCRVKGKAVDEVLTIKNSDIAKHLSLPPVKLHCSMLAEDAIKAAVKDWKKKNNKVASDATQAATAWLRIRRWQVEKQGILVQLFCVKRYIKSQDNAVKNQELLALYFMFMCSC